MRPFSIGILVIAAAATIFMQPTAFSFDLVKDGKPLASIVIPAQPLPVESYAAQELQYHIEASTGTRLEILRENTQIPPIARIYLGNCAAAVAEKIDTSQVAGNGYIVKTNGENLFITGKDSEGDPLDLDTHEGTLFGVYDILENSLGVRWLWPGKLGEIIPRNKSFRFRLTTPSSNRCSGSNNGATIRCPASASGSNASASAAASVPTTVIPSVNTGQDSARHIPNTSQ